MHVLVAIPVKPFGVAKARLASRLDGRERARLGRAVAARTVAISLATGAPTAVITADEGVARWAAGLGVEVIGEDPSPGTGLNRAASAAARLAGERDVPWVILHADLPIITPADLEPALAEILRGSVVISPSYDGGTNLLGGADPSFPFSYGPGSFHRHVRSAAARPVRVVVRAGLALDLDTPRDLDAALAHPAGRWLHELIGTSL